MSVRQNPSRSKEHPMHQDKKQSLLQEYWGWWHFKNNPLPSPPSSKLQAPSSLSMTRLESEQDADQVSKKGVKMPASAPSLSSTKRSLTSSDKLKTTRERVIKHPMLDKSRQELNETLTMIKFLDNHNWYWKLIRSQLLLQLSSQLHNNIQPSNQLSS